jgi:hypothetical protein
MSMQMATRERENRERKHQNVISRPRSYVTTIPEIYRRPNIDKQKREEKRKMAPI